MYDSNYQAMLVTEPFDTANIVDVSADISTPFELPDKQRQQRGIVLAWAAPVGGHGTIRTPRVPSTRDGPSSNIRWKMESQTENQPVALKAITIIILKLYKRLFIASILRR